MASASLVRTCNDENRIDDNNLRIEVFLPAAVGRRIPRREHFFGSFRQTTIYD